MSEYNFSGNVDRFNQNHFVIYTRKGTKSYQNFSELSQKSLFNYSRNDQG